LFDVPPESFTPPPKVMSGVIRLKRKTTAVEMESEKKLFTLVKAAFNQRRKMLRNSLKSLFDDDFLKDDLFNKRAEQLTIEQFASLTFQMR
jgi:16S rRNA (adenine1518-N6/adenine1519-N6)-dimethyltransferase